MMFRFLQYHKNEIVALFFNVSLYLYTISVRIEKKFIEQVKEKKISLKYRLCHCASCLFGEKEFSSHTDQCAFSKRVTCFFLTERQTLTFIFSFSHNESSFYLEEKSNLSILFQATKEKIVSRCRINSIFIGHSHCRKRISFATTSNSFSFSQRRKFFFSLFDSKKNYFIVK